MLYTHAYPSSLHACFTEPIFTVALTPEYSIIAERRTAGGEHSTTMNQTS